MISFPIRLSTEGSNFVPGFGCGIVKKTGFGVFMMIRSWNRRLLWIIAVDAIIIVLEIAGFVINFPYEHFRMVRFYTQDSNFVAMISCMIQLVYALSRLRSDPSFVFPRWICVLKLISAGTLLITLFIVLTV